MKRDRESDSEYDFGSEADASDEVDLTAEVLHELSTESFRALLPTWHRPCVAPSGDAVLFQQIEADFTLHERLSGFQCFEDKEAVVRLFGVTREGSTVACYVHGFLQYFYVKCPAYFDNNTIAAFKLTLEAKIKKANSKFKNPILAVEETQRQNVMYYRFNRLERFLKVTVSTPGVIREATAILEAGLKLQDDLPQQFELFESKVAFDLRFMIDAGIVGCSWVELRAGTWQRRPWYTSTGMQTQRLANVQFEYDVHYSDIVAHAPEGEYMDVAPLRVLSFDIECAGRPGIFPEAEKDPVIQIANVITLQGSTEPLVKNIFTLKTCAPIPGTQIISFDDENDLLNAWRHFFVASDADLISGYNIVSFDIPFLLDRAKHLEVPAFEYLGRVKNSPTRAVDRVMVTKQTGARASKKINIEGRVILDMFVAIQKDYKLSSYSLNGVSAHFLKEQKEDASIPVVLHT